MFELSEYRSAYAKAVLRLVANGEVIVNNGLATINVLEVGVYFRDTYDFIDEDESDSQSLGCWSKKAPYIAAFKWQLENPKLCVYNNTFRQYNKNKGENTREE